MQLFESSILKLETRWIAVSVLPILLSLIYSGKLKSFKGFGLELEVEPSKFNIEKKGEKLNYSTKENLKLPSDYFYINHTSFLRTNKQTELQKTTGLEGYKLYDIQVKIFSYYTGALEKIEYYLHSSYENPIRTSVDINNNFLLKELAYGEYVMSAKVFMKDIEFPFILERYITLWDSGPRI
ncbi:pYEATS domain-containing protein [Flammeovirga sp. EKP202]|uniref:pYEATS domain-containing protein n=1 Tax=Flammeovirga sp. EKP202 TaxID=2770592 RepID=UPI00165EEA70|nr:pYEATS domain-containing protein [Flammeovirga sp. EKP202]MBD0404492.1 hypothetical protein [Flammeovirga sp. EKP202]